MIHTNRTVTVGNQESVIDSPIILYRGDREVEVEFTLNGNKFTFTNEGNVIKSTNAVHGQLVINTPSGENMFSEVTDCHEGKVVFVITKEMIDELIEIGFYSFQIRLFDESQVSRVTIPPVHQGIDIRNPIAAEDETDIVDIGLVGYSIVRKDESEEDLATFLPNGSYNKTVWEHQDIIGVNRLNKVEDALYTINENMEATDLALLNRVEGINQNVNRQITEFTNQADAEIENFERTINNTVDIFKVDVNAAMSQHRDEVDKELELLDTFDERVTNNTNAIYYVTPEMFGYIHGEDSTQALTDAISYCRTNGAKLICKNITLFADTDFRRISLEITGTLNLQSYICKLGNNSASALGPDQYVNNVNQDTEDYQLKILGAKGQHITINEAPYLKFEMSPAATESSMAYSRFDFLRVSHIWIGNSSPEDTGSLWFNENVINLRRCGSFKIEGTYHHNNNIINGGTFEGSSVIDLDYAINNTFRDIRFEGSPDIICRPNTAHNYFFNSWTSSARRASVSMVDEGYDNKVIYSNIEPRVFTYEIDTRDYSDGHFNVTYDEETDRLVTRAWADYFISPIMPYTCGTTMYARGYGAQLGRTGVFVYDENFNDITSEISRDNDWININGVGGAAPGQALPQTNGWTTNVVELRYIHDERVKYVAFRLYAPTSFKFKRVQVWITAGEQMYYV